MWYMNTNEHNSYLNSNVMNLSFSSKEIMLKFSNISLALLHHADLIKQHKLLLYATLIFSQTFSTREPYRCIILRKTKCLK